MLNDNILKIGQEMDKISKILLQTISHNQFTFVLFKYIVLIISEYPIEPHFL